MDDERFEFMILVNHEDQYSLWPAFKEVPNGWRQVGPTGTKQECLEFVEDVWMDMRPLSVRRQLLDAEAGE